MTKWIERQGKGGERKTVKARNRLGGYVNGSRDHGWSRHNRDLVSEQVGIRLFKQDVGGTADGTQSIEREEDFCPVTGERKPAGGGVVQFGDCFEPWLSIYYNADGRIVSAHA